MKTTVLKYLNTFSTGFIVLLLVSIALFISRFYCDSFLFSQMDDKITDTRIEPSRLLADEIELDPNVAYHSSFSTRIFSQELRNKYLGISEYFHRIDPDGYQRENFFEYSPSTNLYFDKKTGLIVLKKQAKDKEEILYAGPEGVLQTPAKELGRFVEPIKPGFDINWTIITYDKKLRRFYKIDFNEKEVTKGSQLKKNDNFNPVLIGRIEKDYYMINIRWSEPREKIKIADEEKATGYRITEEPTVSLFYPPAGQFIQFLDQSGQIFLLDRQTLEITGKAGYLPAPYTFFSSFDSGSDELVKPDDLLAFVVEPVALRPEGKYLGMGVAALSREGTSVKTAVFDSNGLLITETYTGIGRDLYGDLDGDGTYESHRYIITTDSSKAFFLGKPWSPFVMVIRFLLENLQAPALNLASYFTAESIEASAGKRAFFLLPNSFVAKKAGQGYGNPILVFFGALLLMSPSIILSTILSCSAAKDASNLGLTKNSRLCWIIGIIAFGLVGYITYRLTRSKITLVTCANCGRGRRPDMLTCHRCGSVWNQP